MSFRPTWAEVSLGALRRNYRKIQQHVGENVQVCAVVKADAYGHGAVECAEALHQAGASWFGVTSTREGIALRENALREAGNRERILLMTGFWRGDETEIVERHLTPAVWQTWELELLERAASRPVSRPASRPAAGPAGTPQAQSDRSSSAIPLHIKIDTGMGRLGVPMNELEQFAAAVKRCSHLRVEGAMTHIASAEITDAGSNDLQLARFDEALATLQRNGIMPEIVHAANSAAIVSRPAAWHSMVRPGISLYGYYLPFLSSSGRPTQQTGLDVEPVLSWKTRIVGMRQVEAGQGIGYNAAWIARAAAKIAVLPVGYADGLNRHLSSVGRVLVRGQAAPIVGNISMDITLIDVTAVAGAEIGDEVILLGSASDAQGNTHRIDAWEHATLAHTIPYEILCGISKRVPRRYVE